MDVEVRRLVVDHEAKQLFYIRHGLGRSLSNSAFGLATNIGSRSGDVEPSPPAVFGPAWPGMP